MIRSKVGVILVALALAATPWRAVAEEPKTEDIEAARAELLKRWGVSGLVRPAEVDSAARVLLAQPLEAQSTADLLALAKKANAAANYVGFILEEYADYYRDNYKYEFVQNKVAPFHDAYVQLSNRLKDYRNQAYFNLGRKAAAQGDEISALFYFRDAYRLSTFTEDAGDHKGMRYLAEIEMKKLLGIENVGTFLYWK